MQFIFKSKVLFFEMLIIQKINRVTTPVFKKKCKTNAINQ